MISRRSFLAHLLAAAAALPILGTGHADAAKPAVSAKPPGKNSGKHSASRRLHRRRKYASVPGRRRTAYMRAPRSRLEEGWPFGFMDPGWPARSGDPFFDPRWN